MNIMKQGQDLTDVTVRILNGMRDVFKECKPDVVLVHGDTTKAKKELGWNPQTTSFEELVELMVHHDMAKVKADHVAAEVRTNLAEYLEKGIVK